jgi:hypothetical protein
MKNRQAKSIKQHAKVGIYQTSYNVYFTTRYLYIKMIIDTSPNRGVLYKYQITLTFLIFI